MLEHIFANLDEWLCLETSKARTHGLTPLPACEFKIVGQTALLAASLNMSIAATADVDAISNAAYAVTAKLNELLRAEGLELDPLSNDIWMPAEARYFDLFRGRMVTALRADPVHVLVSKALKAPAKNKRLIGAYIAGQPAEEFFALCKKYKVDLKRLLEA